jgi:hypothetical protein
MKANERDLPVSALDSTAFHLVEWALDAGLVLESPLLASVSAY